MHGQVVVGVWDGRRAPAVTRARRRRRVGESGAVTAEAAAVLPVLVAFTLGLVWLLGVAVAQVRVVDGAREAARAAARGDSDGQAVGRARRIAPPGARIAVARDGGQVTATVTAYATGPGGLFAVLPGIELSSRAVATEEPR